MARVEVREGRDKDLYEFERVPVAGDYIAKGRKAVQVTDVVLTPNAPVDAVVFAAANQQNLSDDVKAAISELEVVTG